MPLQHGSRYWICHPELSFVPATYKGSAGKKEKFDFEGEEMLLATETDLPRVIETQLHGVDDACELEEAELAAVLHTVKVRYMKPTPAIYTRVARIMIAMNPFQPLPSMFNLATIKKFQAAADSVDLEPHIFGIGSDAVKGLKEVDLKNQAVLVSGESGAGKTESTKLVLSYVLEAVEAGQSDLQEKIMRTNPILESFGNAKTVRNNNSSRFGKWMEMSVRRADHKPYIDKCRITDYLLEVTRVCKQTSQERNYHIFFQIVESKALYQNSFPILTVEDYQYLKNGLRKAPGINDEEFHGEVKDAFDALGLSEEAQIEIFRLVGGVLMLGNLDFDDIGNDSSKVRSDKPLEDASTCFGVDKESIRKVVLERQMICGKEVQYAGRTAVQAKQAADSLARLIYGRLFKWLVQTINATLNPAAAQTTDTAQFFGVLDIAGFESFDMNSLEQLFINLSNEHLQHYFNDHIFKMEMSECRAEGIEVDGRLGYEDNSEIIALIDSKASILSHLDEEISVPQGSDKTFLSKTIKAFTSSSRFIVPPAQQGVNIFGVLHYAGKVVYTVDGFLEKNVDRPPPDAADVFQSSSIKVLQSIGNLIRDEQAEGKKNKKTVGGVFRQSLHQLMTKLAKAEPHFIRCIKPNSKNVPNNFMPPMVTDQLINSGVCEAVRIRQSGFCMRVAFIDFIKRYKPILGKQQQATLKGMPQDDLKAIAQYMVQVLPAPLSSVGVYQDGDMCCGTTRVFCRQPAQLLLNRALDMSLVGFAITIQRVYRGHQARKKIRDAKLCYQHARQWLKEHRGLYKTKDVSSTAYKKYEKSEAILAASTDGQERLQKTKKYTLNFAEYKEMADLCEKILDEGNLLATVDAAQNSTDPLELERIVQQCYAFNLQCGPAEKIKVRAENLKIQLPLIEAMEVAIQAAELDHMKEVYAEIERTGMLEIPGRWLGDLGAHEIAKKFFAEHEKKVKQEATGVDPGDAAGEPKRQAKLKKRLTITNLSQDRIFLMVRDLVKATEEFDSSALESTLKIAFKNGLADDDTVVQAQNVYWNMSQPQWLTEKAEEEAKTGKKGGTQAAKALRRLDNLVAHSQKINMTRATQETLKKSRQEVIQLRARQTLSGKMFAQLDDLDLDEQHMIDESFRDLSKYSGLKPEEERMKDPNGTLTHVRAPLKAALTDVGPAFEKPSLLAFHHILALMGDKSQPELARVNLHDEIVTLAKSSKALADEIYMQVMKQNTGNPSARSIARGWNLMLSLCQQAPPGQKFHNFVHVFCMRGLNSCGINNRTVIEQSIAALNRNANGGGKQTNASPPLQLLLPDGSFRWTTVNTNATAQQATEYICGDVGIGNTADWALHVITEPHNVQRLLPKQASIMFILKTLGSIKDETGKKSWLLLKRLALKKGEILDAREMIHATLTFHQALREYLSCPLPSTHRDLCLDIAASLVNLDPDNHKDILSGQDDTTNPEALDHLVPPSQRQWFPPNYNFSEQILSRSENLAKEGAMNPSKRLLTMNHVFQLFQQMPVFGCYWWDGTIVSGQPDHLFDSKTLLAARSALCRRNGQDPDATEVKLVDIPAVRRAILALNYQDISIYDKTTGDELFRFGFAGMADERILAWEVKGKLLQCLVTTKKDDLVDLRMLNFRRVGVNDIAYAIETLYKTSGWKRWT